MRKKGDFFFGQPRCEKNSVAMSQESNDDQCAECDLGGELQCCRYAVECMVVKMVI